ncbi:MAG: hypothetical protein K6E62_00205 [Lachnospiraceae bacterium]|nr:hypothetical protein [Lachnospiraceae bacterium]
MTDEKLKAFAAELDGTTDYPVIKLGKKAKEEGIVIVHGCSDDLVEFEGAYEEEAGGVYDGGTIYFDRDGTSDDGNIHNNKLSVYWCGMLNGEKKRDYEFTWEYETDIPHETFRMYEDGEPYCKGIVFYEREMR